MVLLLICVAAAGVAAHTGGYLASTFDLLSGSQKAETKQLPTANADGKRDRLAPELRLRFPETPSGQLVTHSLETAQSYLAFPMSVRPAAIRPAPKPLPKASNALLNDATLAGMKARLRLSRDQERLWPPVENALRVVVTKLYEAHKRNPSADIPPIDLEGTEMQDLKSAVGPFIRRLSEAQKNEVRSLARIVGLEKAIFSL